MRAAGIEYSENEEGRDKKKVKTLRWISRDDQDESPGEDDVDEAAPDDDEEQTEDPYDFEDIWVSDPDEPGGE